MSVTLLAAVATCVGPAAATLCAQIEDVESARVAVLFSPKRSYRAAASAIELTLRAKGLECTLIEVPKAGDEAARAEALRKLIDANPHVIAAGGTAATTLALQTVPQVPVVFFMVPNALDARFLVERYSERSRVAGVASDVSPAEQINWIVQVHPDVTSVAVLHSPRSKRTVEAVEAATTARGIRCVVIEASKARFPEAIEALNRSGCDGVLMIPDARVYNAPTVQRLLLWGARQRKGVWAFSENLVRAGALAGQYPNNRAVGRQAAELIYKVITGSRVATIGLQYPDDVGRAVNEHTADTIGVPLNGRAFDAAVVRYGDE